MIRLRRAPALLLTVPLLLVGCASDVVDGSGAPGSASQSGGFPSGSSTTGSTGPTGLPSSGGPSSAPAGSLVSLRSLSGTATTVELDPGFVSALTALKVTPGLVGTARLSGSSITFPVTGGTIAVYASGAPQVASGSVEHAGSGLTLTAGGTTISLTELRIDVGDAPQVNGTATVNGKVVVRAVTLFDIDDESVRAAGSAGTATVTGLSLRTDGGLADLLNTSFRTSAFTSGLVLGTATMALTGR